MANLPEHIYAEASFNPEGGTVTQQGKIVYQDGKRISDYTGSSAEANSLMASYNSQLQESQSMRMTEEMMAMGTEQAKELAQLNFDLTEKQTEANIKRFPQTTSLATSEAGKTATSLNSLMEDAFYGALDKLMPSWREDIVGAAGTAQADSVAMTEAFKKNVLPGAMAAADEMSMQALSNVNAQLRGEISDSTAAQLKGRAAEISQQIGIRGQASQFLTARDLGRTSEDIQQQGLTNAPAALALGSDAYSRFTQTLQNPVTTGLNATNLLKAYMAPQTDIQSLYGTNAAVLAQSSIVPAGTAMQINAGTIQAATALTANAYMGALEYNSQQTWNTQNLLMQQAALKQQESASKMTMWSGLAGDALSAGATAYARK
jgi:hypothetical protein